MLSSIFQEYDIEKKIVLVITDNGSNFVKAFQDYGVKLFDEDLLADEEVNDSSEEDLSDTEEDLELASIQHTEIPSAVFEDVFSLPSHYRCLSHTLSLVATTDFDKVSKLDTLTVIIS